MTLAETDRRTVLALARRIDRRGDTGRAPKWAVETLEFGDYITFGGPRPGVSPYNCYRLTERGRALLTEEDARIEAMFGGWGNPVQILGLPTV